MAAVHLLDKVIAPSALHRGGDEYNLHFYIYFYLYASFPKPSEQVKFNLLRDMILASKLDHHVWNLDILPRLIVRSNFKDDILLMVRNRVPAHRLHEIVQSD